MKRDARWTDRYVSGSSEMSGGKSRVKGACFKEQRCRERRKSNETSPADVTWLKVQTSVDDWKIVGSLYSVLTVEQ